MHRLWVDSETAINYAINWLNTSEILIDRGKDSINLRYINKENENNLDASFIFENIRAKIREWKDPVHIINSLNDGSFSLKVKLAAKSVVMSHELVDLDVYNWDNSNLDKSNPELELTCDESFLDMVEEIYREDFEMAISDYETHDWVVSSYQLSNDNKNDDIHKKFIRLYNFQQLRNGEEPVDNLTDDNKEHLQTYFKTVVYKTWRKVDNIDENILKELEERNRRLHEFINKNKWDNDRLQAKDNNTDENNNENTKIETIDLQTASWEEIAKDAWLWKELSKEYKNDNIQDDSQLDEKAFSEARDNFNPDSNLKKYFKKDTIQKFCDKNGGTITIKGENDPVRNELNKLWLKQNANGELSSFLKKVNSIKEILIKNSKFAEAVKNEENNNKAIWSIIDDVRSIFSEKQENGEWNISIGKWLELKNQNPVKIEWDNLIISWKFDWVDVTVHYNLKTGELFMNSFLQHEDLSKIKLWDNLLTNVWQLASFDNVVTNDELLKSQENLQVKLLNNTVKEKVEKQGTVNSAITKFMTTFNIMSPSWWFSSLDFNEWSNLFDVIQIIERTADSEDGDSQSLEYFNSTFMPIMMEHSWLKWWERNDHQDKEWQKSKNIFSYNGDNGYINCLKDKTKDFNPEQFLWVANFESQHQLWFADLIKEKIITWKKPDRKLDEEKMREFVNGVEWKQLA